MSSGQKESVFRGLFNRNLKTTSARCLPGRKGAGLEKGIALHSMHFSETTDPGTHRFSNL